MKLHIQGDSITFWCPGCDTAHRVVTPRWTFNGDIEKPTLSPSVLSTYGDLPKRCHLFLRDGHLQFLGDCTHDLAGQTVELPELPWDDN